MVFRVEVNQSVLEEDLDRGLKLALKQQLYTVNYQSDGMWKFYSLRFNDLRLISNICDCTRIRYA